MKNKKVFITSRRWDKNSLRFRKALERELKSRGVGVVISDSSYDIFNFFRKHRTYDIAIAIDFYRDGGQGCGLTLNRNGTAMSRDFAFAVSDRLDIAMPSVVWREFNFVDSTENVWYKFFNKVSSDVKVLFYLCTSDNERDWEIYSVAFKDIVKLFADEIVRCLRANRSNRNYNIAVKAAKSKLKEYRERNG